MKKTTLNTLRKVHLFYGWHAFVLVAILLNCLHVNFSLAQPGTIPPIAPLHEIIPPNRAQFDWSMPPRFQEHFFSYDRRTSRYLQSYINPKFWNLDLDASKIVFSPIGRQVSFRWTIEKIIVNPTDVAYSETIITQNPTLRVGSIPSLGKYKVKLELLNGSMVVFSQLEKVITLQDFLIIAIGDSLNSGEGNPDVIGVADDESSKTIIPYAYSKSYDCQDPSLVKLWANGKVPMIESPVWIEPRAHRSEQSGVALAAKEYEWLSKKSSVTFLTFATSGAKIDKGLIGAQHDWQQMGQIGEITRNLQGISREIDLLIISIGGNDIGFSKWVEEATLSDVIRPVLNFPGTGDRALKGITLEIDKLDASFNNLYVTLNTSIKYKRVLLSTYPTDLFFGEGDTMNDCGLFAKKEILSYDAVDGINGKEAALFRDMAVELNRKIAMNGLKFFGLDGGKWDVISVLEEFMGHGYCSGRENCYFVYASDACEKQGDLDGVLHPNLLGHMIYRDKYVEKMKRYFDDPGIVN